MFHSNLKIDLGYEVGNYGSCPGDSGGPIVVFDERKSPPHYEQVMKYINGL